MGGTLVVVLCSCRMDEWAGIIALTEHSLNRPLQKYFRPGDWRIGDAMSDQLPMQSSDVLCISCVLACISGVSVVGLCS